ncbi:hypothetical protein OAF54_03065 [bacterium]|nr:hypothetical protein [bacterium]
MSTMNICLIIAGILLLILVILLFMLFRKVGKNQKSIKNSESVMVERLARLENNVQVLKQKETVEIPQELDLDAQLQNEFKQLDEESNIESKELKSQPAFEPSPPLSSPPSPSPPLSSPPPRLRKSALRTPIKEQNEPVINIDLSDFKATMNTLKKRPIEVASSPQYTGALFKETLVEEKPGQPPFAEELD